MEKRYSLYSNKEQDELYACAYSLKELKEVSLEYTNGVWFVYDVEKREGHIDTLLNEKQYKGKIIFATEIKKKEKEENSEEFMLKDTIGELR